MNKKTKKAVTIMSVCLVILIAITIAIGMKGKIEKDNPEKDDSVAEKQEDVQEIEMGTDQSELEVVREEPAQIENNEIVEKKEATYEEWLAAAMIVGVSLQYPEFDFSGIYLASESELGNTDESQGAYLIFTCGGEEIAIHSKPIGEERTEAGTKDLYTEDLGYASFDEVDSDSIAKDECMSVEMDDLSELISQSVLVTVYEH